MKINQLVEAKYVGNKSLEVFLNKYFRTGDDINAMFGQEEPPRETLYQLKDQFMGKFKNDNREWEFRYVAVYAHHGNNYIDLHDEDTYDIFSDLREDTFLNSVGIFEKPKQLYP